MSGGIVVQLGQQLLLTVWRHFNRPAGRAAQPALAGEVLVKLVCQLATEVVATFGPVEAAVREATPAVGRTGNQPQPFEPRPTRVREFEAAAGRCEASSPLKGVVDRNPELACQVAVIRILFH